jgi:hypothetical protein
MIQRDPHGAMIFQSRSVARFGVSSPREQGASALNKPAIS